MGVFNRPPAKVNIKGKSIKELGAKAGAATRGLVGWSQHQVAGAKGVGGRFAGLAGSLGVMGGGPGIDADVLAKTVAREVVQALKDGGRLPDIKRTNTRGLG